jgi:hypothetical protein
MSTPATQRHVLLQYVMSAATLVTSVLLPRTSVMQRTSRVFPAGESTQTASTAGRARRLCYPSSWRAAPCGPVPIVFQEKKSSCDVPVPSGP